jgi:drug/metabolite transporter (DMT)-like permease
VTGIAFGALAKSTADQLSRPDQPWDPSKDASNQTDRILTGVFLGIGGAAIIAGTVLIVRGIRQERAHRFSAMVTPVFSSQSGGAMVRVDF